MDTGEGVDIWYQVEDEGRDTAMIKGFTGQYVNDLLSAIRDNEGLQCAASQLQPFVNEMISLRELEDDIDLPEMLDFKVLVNEYRITRRNPIIIRLPGTLLSSRLFGFLTAISFLDSIWEGKQHGFF